MPPNRVRAAQSVRSVFPSPLYQATSNSTNQNNVPTRRHWEFNTRREFPSIELPPRVYQTLMGLVETQGASLSVTQVRLINDHYIAWTRFYENNTRRASVMNDLHNSIKALFRVWFQNFEAMRRHISSLYIPNRRFESERNIIIEIMQLTERSIPSNQKYKETAYLIPFLSRVMSSFSIISHFDALARKLAENQSSNRLTPLIDAHEKVATQLRELKRIRRTARVDRRTERARTGAESPRRRRTRRPFMRPPEPRVGWMNQVVSRGRTHARSTSSSESNTSSNGSRMSFSSPSSRNTSSNNNRNEYNLFSRVDPSQMTKAEVNAIPLQKIPKNAPEISKVNLDTLEPMNKGIKLKCGHYISRATLKGLVTSKDKMKCPFCRREIKKDNFKS